MADQKRLAYSIIQFLHDQLQNGGLSPDAQESLEGRWPFCLCVDLSAQLMEQFGRLVAVLCLITCLGCF